MKMVIDAVVLMATMLFSVWFALGLEWILLQGLFRVLASPARTACHQILCLQSRREGGE